MILFIANAIIIFIVALISMAVNALNVEDLKNKENVNIAVNIEIKVFGEKGMEWTVKGESLNIDEPVVFFKNPVLKLDGYTIKADFAEVDRIKKVGNMKGNIEIFGEDLYAKTSEIFIDMNKNIIKGDTDIIIRRADHDISGKGFTMHLKPFKAIIGEAYATYNN